MSSNTIHYDLLGSETRFIGSDPDTRSRVLTSGSEGPALIMLHGGGGHAETYSRNIVPLGKHSRVYAPDFLWHGWGACPPFREGNWLRQFTEQIIDLMDCEGIERACIEGESLGAWISMDMAINFPDRVDSIILNTAWGMRFVESEVKANPDDLVDLRNRSLEGLRTLDFQALRSRLSWLVHNPDQVTDEIVDIRLKLWSREAIRTSLAYYYEHVFLPEMDPYLFTEKDLRTIECPTLVMWTENNPFQGVEAADRLHSLIPNSSVEIVSSAGHWPQWENADEHDRMVLEFLGVDKVGG